MAMDISRLDPKTLSAAVFFACYVYICASHRFRATVLWAGVILLLALGVYQPDGQRGPGPGVLYLLQHINWDVLMIFAGAMAVAELFIVSKVPVLLADLIVRHLKTVGGATLGVCVLSGFLSAFIENVATVLIVAPVALELARRLKTSPVHMLIGIAIMSNLQGAATLIGDPPSLILADGFHMSFLDFFFFKGRPSIFWAIQMGAVCSALLLWMMFFRKLRQPVARPELIKPMSWVPSIILVLMIVGLSLTSSFGDSLPFGSQFANGAVCMLAAVVGIVWHLQHGVRNTFRMVLRVDVQTVSLLAAIFALSLALEKTGFIGEIAGWVASLVGTNEFLAYTIIVWVSVLLSAVIDNVPYTALMVPTVIQIASQMTGETTITRTHILLGLGLLIGACLGGNITPVGASANIVSVGLLRKNGYHVSFWTFVRMGLPFTIAATVPAYLLVWFLWGY